MIIVDKQVLRDHHGQFLYYLTGLIDKAQLLKSLKYQGYDEDTAKYIIEQFETQKDAIVTAYLEEYAHIIDKILKKQRDIYG